MQFSTASSRRFIAAVAAVLVMALPVLAGCSRQAADTADQRQKRQAYQQATQKVPFPQEALKNPLERANAAKKLKLDSNPARLSYVYLLSLDGKVIAHFVARGKVSSADSQLLPTQEVRDVCGDGCVERMQFEAAGDDATYGAREPGIFFFTPEDQLITWSGDYIQSDRPLKIQTPVSLVANVK